MAPQSPEPKLTALQFKELLIERYELSHPDEMMITESSDPIDFNKTYQNLAGLDMDMVDTSRTSLQMGNDMASTYWNLALNHMKLQVGSEKLKAAMVDAELMSEMIKLLNADLRATRPDLKEEVIQKMNTSTKVLSIINHRLEKSIVRLPKLKTSKRRMKTEFYISLTKLVNGDGSDCRSTGMYLDVTMPFEEFLKTLRIETKFCLMPENYPPLYADSGSSQCGDASAAVSFTTTTEKESQETWYTAETSHTLQGDNSNNENAKKGPGSNLIGGSNTAGGDYGKKETPRKEPGFTLADGPWMYFIAYKAKRKERTALMRLANKEDYDEMIKYLTMVGSESCAVITHSKECERQELWEWEVAEEEADQARIREEIKGLDPFDDGDEEDVGEDYMILMRKKNNRSAELWPGRFFPLF